MWKTRYMHDSLLERNWEGYYVYSLGMGEKYLYL
jgi:hypothetical protein